METNKDYKVLIALSCDFLEEQNNIELFEAAVHKKLIYASSSEILEYLKKGYTISNAFDSKIFYKSFMSEKTFLESNVICVETVPNKENLNDSIDKLSIKPTLAYSTEDKAFCYLYVFYTEIKTKDEYEKLWEKINNMVKEETNSEMNQTHKNIDSCIVGNIFCDTSYMSGNVYDISDFNSLKIIEKPKKVETNSAAPINILRLRRKSLRNSM